MNMSTYDPERLLRNAAVLVHLTGAELDGYADGALDEITQHRAVAHLKRCLICERRLAVFQEARQALASPEPPTAEDRALIRRIVDRVASAQAARQKPVVQHPRITLLENVRLAAAASSGSATSGSTPDGLLTWQIEETRTRDLVVRLRSNTSELEGARLHLEAGDVQQEVALRRDRYDEILAEATIKRADRIRVPSNVPLVVHMVDNDEEGAAAGSVTNGATCC